MQNLTGNLSLTYKATPWMTITKPSGYYEITRGLVKNTVSKFLYSDWAKNQSHLFLLHSTGMVMVRVIYRAITDNLGSVTDYANTETLSTTNSRFS